MSKRLRYIPETCPIYRDLEDEVKFIKDNLGEDVSYDVDRALDAILDYADQIRNTCADLRETAKDIANEKNGEIDDLRFESEKKIEEYQDKIYELECRFFDLEQQLESSEVAV